VMEKNFDVPDPVTGLPEVAANEKADPTASLIKNTSTEIDASDTNTPFSPFTNGSAFGFWYKLRRWFRLFSSRSMSPTAKKTASYTAKAGQLVPYDPSGGTFTLKPPENPSIGDQFGIVEVGGSSASITVDGNGESIEKANDLGNWDTSFTLNGAAYIVVIWSFIPHASGNVWNIISIKQVPA